MANTYKKIKEKFIDDINSCVVIYEHNKTKARICTIKNDDRNKVFSISFRTPAINSCGLTHILEHSVLCGSKKYPVKDPFVELMKSSLNTFLNAFTFPDKTMYPIASLDLKDFHNLMDVYLDSVLNPNIYQKKEIFMQEGWHYEINDDGELSYNGVVYNEMKGAFSDPEEVLFRTVLASLFPDTSYSLEAGGDPKFIPDLSYEEFINFHKKYYHPSNSYIYLYGNLNMDDELRYLDEAYLSKYDFDDFDTKIKIQKPFDKPIYKTEYYQSDEKNNTYLSYNIALPANASNKLIIAFDLLVSVLLQTPGAPLKEALIKANIADSIENNFDDGLIEPIFSIYAVNSKEDKEQDFINIINNKLTELSNGALDKKSLEAIIRFSDFKAREKDFSSGFPKGLSINIDLMTKWLYDENNPFDKLEEIKYYKELLEDLKTDYFENIIKDYILNNNHKSYVKLVGKKDIKEKEELRIKEKLKLYKDSLTLDELKLLKEENIKLNKFQSEESTKEELDTLPKLCIDEIDLKPVDAKLEVINGLYETLFSDYEINGISYVYYYFDLSKLNYEDLKYLSLYTKLFIHFDTNNNNYQKLNELIQAYTGGISSSIITIKRKDKDVLIKLVYSFSAIKENVKFASKLLDEMIDRNFDNKIRLKEKLIEFSSVLHNSLASAASSVATSRAVSCIDELSRIRQNTSGLDFVYFIDELINDFDMKYDYIVNKLNNIKNLLSKSNFSLAITSNKADYNELKPIYDNFYEKLKDNVSYEKYKFEIKCKNEGLIAPFDVNFTANCAKYEGNFKGSYLLASSIINTNFLWPQIRV